MRMAARPRCPRCGGPIFTEEVSPHEYEMRCLLCSRIWEGPADVPSFQARPLPLIEVGRNRKHLW